MGKIKNTVIYLLMIIMLLSGCSIGKPKPTIDPHEGQVYLYDGYDWVWYTPVEGVETNAFSKSDFQFINNQPVYIGSGYTVKKGICK